MGVDYKVPALWMIFGFDSFCWFGGLWHGLSHRSPNKVAEQCSQDKFPDPTEAAGGGQLMDGRGRNSQLPSNLCLGNKLLLSLVSAPALQAPPSLQSPPCSPALLCQPRNAASGSGDGAGRGGVRRTFCLVLCSPLAATGLPPRVSSLQGGACRGPAASLRTSVLLSEKGKGF